MRYFFSLLLALPILIAACNSQSTMTMRMNTATPPPALPHDPTPLGQPALATADCPINAPPAEPVHNLAELLPGCDYATWFETNTGYEPDDSYFGSYAFLPWNNALYLGWGTARPAESNGSLFSRYQSNTLTAIYQPSEQGFIEMSKDVALPIIHIPGPDPTDSPGSGGSQWDLGNTYAYTPTTGTIAKYRNLPDVIHTWGLESTPTGLYAAAGAHMGDYETWTGDVFRSTDMGEHWVQLADKDAGVGEYRTYDIIQFNNKLYVVWNDVYGGNCGLAESSDGGTHWTRLNNFTGYTQCRSRLFIYQNQLLIIGSARDGILALHADGSVSTHLFPDFHVQDWAYNPFAVDDQNRLYVVSEDNRILRTNDLNSWETMVASDRDFITLTYWADADRIIVGDRGDVGSLWQLDPDAAAVNRPQTIEPSIELVGDDVVIQWPAQIGLTYRIYRNDENDFTPPHAYFYNTVTGMTWTDSGAGAQPGETFYMVRSQNTSGEISGPSRILAKYTFEVSQ